MNEQMIFEQVRKATAEVLRIPEDTITKESRFREDLGADSLDLISLLMMLDQELNTTLPDERNAGVISVGDAVRFVKTHLDQTS
jgi:acyl carrier protein